MTLPNARAYRIGRDTGDDMTIDGIDHLKRWLKYYAGLAAVPFAFGILSVWLPFLLLLVIWVGLAGLYLAAIAVTIRWSFAAWETMPLGGTTTRRIAAILIPPALLVAGVLPFSRSRGSAATSDCFLKSRYIISGSSTSLQRRRLDRLRRVGVRSMA